MATAFVLSTFSHCQQFLNGTMEKEIQRSKSDIHHKRKIADGSGVSCLFFLFSVTTQCGAAMYTNVGHPASNSGSRHVYIITCVHGLDRIDTEVQHDR